LIVVSNYSIFKEVKRKEKEKETKTKTSRSTWLSPLARKVACFFQDVSLATKLHCLALSALCEWPK
jgi:hypothetical protein